MTNAAAVAALQMQDRVEVKIGPAWERGFFFGWNRSGRRMVVEIADSGVRREFKHGEVRPAVSK